MSKDMLDTVTGDLHQWFPEQWSEGDVERYLGGSKFTRDLDAYNKTLNLPIRDFIFRGGKRLRPILFLSLLEGFDVNNVAEYKDFASVIEITHNATLVIDDIEDDSELRRGQQTLHKKYGLDVAVNTGVAMHILPLLILLKAHPNLSERQRIRLLQIYSEEIINVYFGQATDISWHNEAKQTVTRDMYMEMCRLKTGSLMRMSARFACAVADIDMEKENLFRGFSEAAGIAFQIKDDVLDIVAKEEDFGKAYGNDITEGKMSLPVILAIEELEDEQAERLKEILTMHTRDKKLIEEARNLLLTTHAIGEAEKIASSMLEGAWEMVKEHIPNKDGRTKVAALVGGFTKRNK